ncbi:hypothetical protein Tco_0929644 [Tanacetum coccineum]
MDDPNLTMEEYIKLEEEKACKHGRVFNWETATYGKIRVDDNLHDLRSMEAEFPAIVAGYTEEIVHDFEQRLETTFGRQVNRVHILHFEGLTPKMRQDLAERMRMVYTRDDGQEMGGARRSIMWRQFILAMGLHTTKEMAEDGFGVYWLGSERLIPDKGDRSGSEVVPKIDLLQHLWEGQAPEKVTATDLFYLRSMDQGEANVPYLLAQYLFRHAEGRKSGARLSGGHFIGHLAHHFGLVSDDRLRRLSVVARELPLIDMGELVKLNICIDLGDDWAWVAPGPERQQVAAAGAPAVAEDAPAIDEGYHGVLTPLMDASGRTYQAFDGTFGGSSPAAFQRRTKQRTGEANTSVA